MHSWHYTCVFHDSVHGFIALYPSCIHYYSCFITLHTCIHITYYGIHVFLPLYSHLKYTVHLYLTLLVTHTSFAVVVEINSIQFNDVFSLQVVSDVNFGVLPWGCQTCRYVTLVNRGGAIVPVRLMISPVSMLVLF